MSEEKAELEPILTRLGIYLQKKDYQLDIKPLVKLVLRNLLGDLSCLVDVINHHIPDAKQNTVEKVRQHYRNERENLVLQTKLEKCDSKEPLCVNIVKLFNNELQSRFYAYGRVISGTLRKGQEVRVLGENYSHDDEDDSAVARA